MTAADVLQRARELLVDELPHTWVTCNWPMGPYCLRCACAAAMSALQREELAAGDTPLDIVRLVVNFDRELPEDAPLLEAVKLIADVEPKPIRALSRDEAIAAVGLALAAVGVWAE